MRVYYFTSSYWGISNLKNKHIKVSRIDNLNDPFDCFVNILNGWRDDFRYLRKQWNEKIGMICFSRDYRNPVQWSHYADRHKGMALGFDVDDNILKSVEYSEEPHIVFFSSHEGSEDEWRDVEFAMCCKFIDWSYEKESRVLLDLNSLDKNNDFYFKKFDSSIQLREIILGINCEVTDEKIIESASDFNGIEVRRASISEDTYEVRKAIFIDNL